MKLSAFDRTLPSSWVHMSFRFETLLDEKVLSKGLEKCFQVHRNYGFGKFDKDNMELIESDKMVELQTIVIEDKSAPGIHSSSNDWFDNEFVSPLRRDLGEESVASVRLTLFPKENVSFIGIALSHAIGDASAVYNFLHAWSECCNGREMEPISYANIVPLKNTNKEDLIDMWRKKKGTINHPIESSEDLKENNEEKDLNEEKKDIEEDESQLLEIVFSNEDLKSIKNEYSKDLKEGEWFSTNELFTAMFLQLFAQAAEKSNEKWESVYVTNMRGRTTFYPNNNVTGNGITFLSIVKDIEAGKLSLSSVLQTHKQLRSLLDNVEHLEFLHSWYEAAREYAPEHKPATLYRGENSILFNEWRSYNWFSIDMGSNKTPSAMRGRFVKWGNFIRIVPISPTHTCFMMLSDNKNFYKNMVELCKDLPCTIFTSHTNLG